MEKALLERCTVLEEAMAQELSGCTALLWLFGQAAVQEFTEVLTASSNKTIFSFSILIFAKIIEQMCENIL
jgi:hypothetical protein